MAWLTEAGPEARSLHLAPNLPFRIGRAEDNQLVIDGDMKVSRRHAELLCRQGTWWIRDCQSRNGTHLNGAEVTDVELHDGDHVRLGGHDFVFSTLEDPMATLEDRPDPPGTGPTLSKREREVLALVASGATDFQIARQLGITVATVHSHLDRIRDKTGRRRRPDLTRLAGELRLDAPA